MKKILLMTLLSAFAFTGCNENGQCPEDIRLLHLESRLESLVPGNMSRTIKIIDGNGGYKIYHPLKVVSTDWTTVANNRELIDARIENDIIIIDGSFEANSSFEAFFLITDAKERKQLLIVNSSYLNESGYNYTSLEKEMLGGNPNDYWDMDNPS